MGWFHPSAEGEHLMPDVVTPLIGNYMQRKRRGEGPPQRFTAAEWARLAEYEKEIRRVGALDLRLRREDGSLVPTETVAIQDVEELLACYPDEDETWEDELDGAFDFFDDDPSARWKRDSDDSLDEADRALRRDMEHDLKLIDEWMEEEAEEENDQWTPEDDEPLPRYQILVLLADEGAVP